MKLLNMVRGTIGRVKFQAIDKAPVIGIVSGTIFFGLSLYSMYKATRKVDGILEEHNAALDELKNIQNIIESDDVPDEYANVTVEDIKSRRGKVYRKTGMKMAVTFAMTFVFGAASLGSFYFSAKELNGRYVGACAALGAVAKDKEHLEKQILDKYGADELAALKKASKDEEIVETHKDENGKEVVDKIVSPNYDAYARLFDSTCPDFEKDPESNLTFLNAKRDWAEYLLRTRGRLFLNEVYDMLNMPRTDEGQVMGWTYDKKKQGNPDHLLVSFGLHDKRNERFMLGLEPVALLIFNVEPTPILGRTGLAVH